MTRTYDHNTFFTSYHCPTCDAEPGTACIAPRGRDDIRHNGHQYRRWIDAMFQLTGRVVDPRNPSW